MRTNELMLYKNMEHGRILKNMTFLMENCGNDYYNREDLRSLLFECMNEILEISASHGFEGNLWHTYLTFLLVNDENAYSTSCEIVGEIDGSRFILISPEELRLPDYIRHEVLDRNNIPYEEVVRLEDAMPSLDILYMTRVQKERFFNEEDYVRMKDFYILDKAKMKLAPEDMYVLHPLPRVNEISTEVDNDPRAAYFRQVQYGVYVRMALILTLLEIHVD